MDKIYNNKRLLLASIFLISILTSSAFLFFWGNLESAQHAIPGTDYLNFYEPVANSILRGEGITLKGELAVSYPPGYPIILAIIFSIAKLLGTSQLGLIVVFNVIVTALATCFLFLIAETIFDKKIGLIASLLWLTYPLNLWFLKNPNTEAPFILLLYAGLWLYLSAIKKKERRFWLIFLSGVILGLASLIRPISLFLPFLLAPLIPLLLREIPKKLCFLLALVFLTGNIAAIFPWEAYVFSATGKIISLSTNGPTAIVDGLTFALIPGAAGDKIAVPKDVFELMQRARSQDLSAFSKILYFSGRESASRPASFLKLVGLKTIRSWYATSQKWWEGKILMLQLIYLIPGFFGIICAFKLCKNKSRESIFLLIAVFYFWGMTILALSILRYMIPAMGLMMIFSAVTTNLLWKKISQ